MRGDGGWPVRRGAIPGDGRRRQPRDCEARRTLTLGGAPTTIRRRSTHAAPPPRAPGSRPAHRLRAAGPEPSAHARGRRHHRAQLERARRHAGLPGEPERRRARRRHRLGRRQWLAGRLGRRHRRAFSRRPHPGAGREPWLRGRQQRRRAGGARRRRGRHPPAEQRHGRRRRFPRAAARGAERRSAGGGGVERDHASRLAAGAAAGLVRHPLRVRPPPPARRQRAARRGLRPAAPGRCGHRLQHADRRRCAGARRPARRVVLRLPRGDRLVPARAQGRVLHLLPAVLAGLAPLLAQHRRAAAGAVAAGEGEGLAAESDPAAVESRPHLSRRTQLRALHPPPCRHRAHALLHGLDALQPAARDARGGGRSRGGAEARPALVPRGAVALLPRGGRRARRSPPDAARGAARAVACAGRPAARAAAGHPARARAGPHRGGRGVRARALGRGAGPPAATRAAGPAMSRADARGLTGRDVVVVVLNWNGARDTVACLESLAAAELGGASVLVVDNGSHDGSVAEIHARFPAQRVVALSENRGYAGGNNAGMEAALAQGAGGVLLLNNDTRVAPDFLGPLLAAMNDSPRSAAVASAVFRLDRPELLDIAYLDVHLHERYVVQLRGVNCLASEGFDRRLQVGAVPGCSLLLRADTLREVGLFDDAYFAYHEDVDWCLRARAAGWEIFFEPYSRVFHRGSGSTARFVRKPPAGTWGTGVPDLPNAEPMPWNPVRTYLGMRNTVRLLRTHADPAQRRLWGRALARELPLEAMAVL